jgi:hypothetical protein
MTRQEAVRIIEDRTGSWEDYSRACQTIKDDEDRRVRFYDAAPTGLSNGAVHVHIHHDQEPRGVIGAMENSAAGRSPRAFP